MTKRVALALSCVGYWLTGEDGNAAAGGGGWLRVERQRGWGMVRFSFAEGILGRLRVGQLLGFGQVREEKKNERLVRRGAPLLPLLRQVEKMRETFQQGGSCCLAGGWRESPNQKGAVLEENQKTSEGGDWFE